jgi:hypothetical protein
VVVWFDQRAYLESPLASVPLAVGQSFAYAQIAVAHQGALTTDARQDALARDPALLATHTQVVRSLRMLEQSTVLSSQLFDAEQLGRFLALRTLCYASPALDWRSTYFAYDPVTQRFVPIGTASPPVADSPLPATFIYDAGVELAYLRTLNTLATLDFAEILRSPWGGDEGRALSTTELTWLRERQEQVQALLSPPRTLFAEANVQNDVLKLRLDALLPFSVELLGIEIGERGLVALDPAWERVSEHTILSSNWDTLLLEARLTASPLSRFVNVPLTTLPVALQGGIDELHLVTRIVGLDKTILVPVTWEAQ